MKRTLLIGTEQNEGMKKTLLFAVVSLQQSSYGNCNEW